MKSKKVLRIEKAPKDNEWDVRAKRTVAEIELFFPQWRFLKVKARSSDVYWIAAEADSAPKVRSALFEEILEDPLFALSDSASVIPEAARPGFRWWCLEKSYRAGVTDNAGHVLAEAVALVTKTEAQCRAGQRLWLEVPESLSETQVRSYADQVFHNALIERFELFSLAEAKTQDESLFKKPTWIQVQASHSSEPHYERFDLTQLKLEELEKISQERIWALSRDELHAVQEHYLKLGRQMTDVEVEVIAQTWSEHCKHKIFSADIEVQNERDDLRLPKRISSVFKTYIRGATREIPASYLKSVFEDNAGVINITKDWDCAIKVETHNSPSALDPYGGALTGIVGVNRDILGVGLGAHPIANLDVFCVGPLDVEEPLPPRLHHPRRILEGVRVGVEHGGNKSGIPTVTGAVVHHPDYLGKPLVFCGTLGLIPTDKDYINKSILPGDKIVMVGGRIGKDGIHGATFSSVELDESSPVSAVQIGDPFTQRRVWDFLIQARDQGLFRAVTDNGAGGLSSSIGELARMCGKQGGARMDVAHARTKYEGLKPYELVVSESQERMSFAVQPENLPAFLKLAERRGVECSVLGEFEDSGRFHILYRGETVADLDLNFLHNGVPLLQLKAKVTKPEKRLTSASGLNIRYGILRELARSEGEESLNSLYDILPHILSHPNVRSRRDVVEQYDHEVQARTVRKPYGTPNRLAPNDGATLRVDRVGFEGIALGLGLAPFAAEIDAKVAAELALDEAVRNALVAGLDPGHAALVDNFCWPDPLPSKTNPDAEEKLGALVVTCQRLYEGAVALRMPFVSGKDSMKNDYRIGDRKISVPPTVLITAMGKVHDVRLVPAGFVREKGRAVLWVSGQETIPNKLGLPQVNFEKTARFAHAFHRLVREGMIESAHDVSDGGWLVATAEMLLGTGFGAELNVHTEEVRVGEPRWAALFGEPATSFVLVVKDEALSEVRREFADFYVEAVGKTTAEPMLKLTGFGEETTWEIKALEQAYAPLSAHHNESTEGHCHA